MRLVLGLGKRLDVAREEQARSGQVPGIWPYDRRGAPDECADGVTSTLVPPGDATALATATVELLDEPRRRVQMGRRAAEHVHRRHGEGRMVCHVAELESATIRGKP